MCIYIYIYIRVCVPTGFYIQWKMKKFHVHHIHHVRKWPSYFCKTWGLCVSHMYMVYLFACLFSVCNTINLSRHEYVLSGPMMCEVSLETVSLNILVHFVINLLYIYISIYIYIYISTSISISIYLYMHICIYIYIYKHKKCQL